MRAIAIRQTVWRWSVGAFCFFHMGAAAVANMPSTTAFGGELRTPFEPYITYAGLWQAWTMFETIPYFRSIRPVLVGHYATGPDVERGAILPGLLRYRHRNRLVALFVRYTFPTPDLEWLVRGYLKRACGAFEAATGTRPATVRLRLDSERLIPLEEVIATGRIGRTSHEFSPVEVKCD